MLNKGTEAIYEVVPIAVLLALGLGFLLLFHRHVTPREARWLSLGFLVQLLGAVARVVVVYFWYGDGDMTSYVKWATIIADWIRAAPGQWAIPYLRYGLHEEGVVLPYDPPGGAGPTSTMFVLSAFFQIWFPGARFAMSIMVGVFSFASKAALYLVFREVFPQVYRPRIVAALFLIPSAVYWTSGFGKEGVAMMTAGWVVFGYYQAFHKRRWLFGSLVLVAAAVPILYIKPYILFPMPIGFAVWEYWRANVGVRTFNPLRSLVIGVVATVVVAVLLHGLGTVAPRYALSGLLEEAESLQELGLERGRGSTYSVQVGSGLPGLIASIPLAVLTAVYRPVIFEVSNAMMLANSLETTFLALLTVYVIRERRVGVILAIQSSPPLMFCLTYVLIFGFATGYASTNLGTLSRYRAPMLPYLGILVAVLTPLPHAARSARRRLGRGRRVVDLPEAPRARALPSTR